MTWITEQNRKWWVVVATGLAIVLITIDFNGVTVALPTIGRDLDTSTTGLQWTINAYLLAFAAPSVAFGRLGDIFGRRRILLIGVVVFVVASALCGLAQTDWWLISARVVQGAGAAAFFAASLPIVSGAFPPEERNKGIAIWAAISGVGLAAGPIVGGVLTETLSWRWFFYFNIPIAALTIFLTLAAVRESRDETVGRNVDLVGLFTVTAGLAVLVFAIQQSDTLGWGAPTVLVSLAVAAVLLTLFVVVEPRLRDPLIELDLFGNRSFFGGTAVAFLSNYGFGALMFFLTLYFQNILGYSPLNTGLIFLAFTVNFALFNYLAGQLGSFFGARLPMVVGMALMVLAALLLALVTPTSGLAIVIVALVVAGVGLGVNNTLANTAGMGAIPEAKAGAASGILGMGRLMGAVFGVAATGALFKALENARLAELLSSAGASLGASERAEIRGLLSGSEAAQAKLAGLNPEAAGQIERIVREAFVYAFDGAMLLCMAVLIVGVLASFLVPGRAAAQRPG